MLIGNVGKDPEVRSLQGGAKVATLTIATSERFKDKDGNIQENTEWHTINAWKNLAEVVEKYVKKGSQLYVEGSIKTRQWTDNSGAKRYTTEILATSLQLLGKKEGEAQPQQRRATPASKPAEPEYNEGEGPDLPF